MIKDFFKSYLWAMYLGFSLGFIGLTFTSWKLYAILIPTVLFETISKDNAQRQAIEKAIKIVAKDRGENKNEYTK